MRSTTAAIIGAGHSGLAMSACLTQLGVEHVLLERGEVANSWRNERWDSLRLLTPNFQSSLPGFAYSGDDPDGFMSMPEVIDFITSYADFVDAPVEATTEVTNVTAAEDGFAVQTSNGPWQCRALVLANGACNIASVPAVGADMPADLVQLTPLQYKSPDALPDGGVLVVGASATGVQLAEEIHLSGRPVTLAVGEHVRMPRRYRGQDILYWMGASGILDEGLEEIDDVVRARNIPSPQLVGTPERKHLDINALTDIGVELVGRFAGIRDDKAMFAGSLKNNCALADLKCNRLLNNIDEWITEAGLDGEAEEGHRLEDTRVPEQPALMVKLRDVGIKSVIWATGFRPDYSWLDLPVLDRKGKLAHDAGVVQPGLYALGLTFLRKRKSSFIHGAADDASYLAGQLRAHLDG